MIQEHGLAVQDITLLADYTCDFIIVIYIYIYVYMCVCVCIYAVNLKYLFCNDLMCIQF